MSVLSFFVDIDLCCLGRKYSFLKGLIKQSFICSIQETGFYLYDMEWIISFQKHL